MKEEKLFSKKDMILFSGILLLAGLIGLACGGHSPKGAYLRITVDGGLYEEYRLEEDREFVIRGAYGENRIVIRQGKVFIGEADCPDQYCVRHPAIERENEVIVCLPHRLVLEIAADRRSGALWEDKEIDGITQ